MQTPRRFWNGRSGMAAFKRLSCISDAVILVFTKVQIIRQAEVRWRKSTEIGVEFGKFSVQPSFMGEGVSRRC
jgi:hypothetical protein